MLHSARQTDKPSRNRMKDFAAVHESGSRTRRRPAVETSVDAGILTVAWHAGDRGTMTRSQGSRPSCERHTESSPRDPKPVACVPSTAQGSRSRQTGGQDAA